MADKKISALTATTTLGDADLMTTVQSGENKKITGSSLKSIFLTPDTIQTISANKNLIAALIVDGDSGGKIQLLTDSPIEIDAGLNLAKKLSGIVGQQTLLQFTLPTGNNTQIFPDKSGTFAMTSDINNRNWGQACRVASILPGTLATDFQNGSLVNGVTLATNDRIIITAQADAKENGVYKVNLAGAPMRDESETSLANHSFWVTEGTTYHDCGFACTNDSITYGVTLIAFALVGSGVYTAGSGLGLTGNQFSLNTDLPNGTTATTQLVGDNTTKLATTAFVQAAIPVLINPVTDAYTPILGQTIFTLSQTRSADFHFILTLNGVIREEDTDFTVSGTTLTWLDPFGLTLKTTDRLIARYYY